MKKLKKLALATAAAAALLGSWPAGAQTLPSYLDLATYDGQTGNLTLPFVQIGNTLYSNVVVRLRAFDILSVGSGVAPTCADTDLTRVKLDAIAVGMTVDRVNQMIGCAYTPNAIDTRTYAQYGSTTYTWQSAGGRSIKVWFNNTSGLVALWSENAGYFKEAWPYYGF